MILLRFDVITGGTFRNHFILVTQLKKLAPVKKIDIYWNVQINRTLQANSPVPK